MGKLFEKLILIIFSLYFTYIFYPENDLVFYFLISTVFSLSFDLLPKAKTRIVLYLLFIMLIFYDNLFLFYLPVIFYNMYFDFKFYSIFSLPFLVIDFHDIFLLLFILSLYFSKSNIKMESMIKKNKHTRDNLRQEALYLKKYNRQLEIDEEKNIQIAILTERNRIAREIHDSIGHSLSSSILQVKALKIMSEPNLAQPIDLLQQTLSNGMDEIRNSLKGIRNNSLELESKIQDIIKGIPNLDIKLFYDMERDLEYELKFDIISIIKESITNTIKHSNATILDINLLSHPKFYIVNINDNGDYETNCENKGIGLDFMNETASKYDGSFNYKFDNGFKIHLTLMKGK